jgi:hypothetical protein
MLNKRTIDKGLIELCSTSYFRDQTQLISIVLAKHFCGGGTDSLLKTCSLVFGSVWQVLCRAQSANAVGGQSEAMDRLLHASDRGF